MKNYSAQQIIDLDRQYIWHPYTSLQASPPLPVAGAKGACLFLMDGRNIIDAVSSWWVNIHGHSHPVLNEALADQAGLMEQVIFAGFTHEPAVYLAEALAHVLPAGINFSFFSDNGSTAVEVAVKMALQYWKNQGQQRGHIVALQGSYHGDTFGTMSLGERGAFNAAFSDYLFDVLMLEVPACRNVHRDLNDAETACVEQFRQLCENNAVAAFIYEPLVQGAGGMRFYKEELLRQLLAVARQHDIICIADEVMTGFGRTGTPFVSNRAGLAPDIMCLSKGLTGGYMPLGLTVCNPRIRNAFNSAEKQHTLYHGHSFTANPLACAVALASLRLFTSTESEQDRLRIGQCHQKFAEKLLTHEGLCNVRTEGTILAFEVETGEGATYFSQIRDWLYNQFLERNVLLRPLGNTVYIMPPYCITNAELEQVYTAIREVIAQVPAMLQPPASPDQG